MGIRQRKNLLITTLKARALASKLAPDVVAAFELMYRRARTAGEQDQVTVALAAQTDGWKTDDDSYSRLLRNALDMDDGPFAEEDDDRLPPHMEEAIARARVDVSRRRSV